MTVTSLFCGAESEFGFQTTVWCRTEMWGGGRHLISQLQTSGARHILAGNIHRVSSNRPHPWSSSHRITAKAPQSKYAYSNLWLKGGVFEIYATGWIWIHQWAMRHPYCVIMCCRERSLAALQQVNPASGWITFGLHTLTIDYATIMAYRTEERAPWNRNQTKYRDSSK